MRADGVALSLCAVTALLFACDDGDDAPAADAAVDVGLDAAEAGDSEPPDALPPDGAVLDAATPDALQPDAAPVEVTATVESGELRGVELGGVASFLGVPYAAPPVGELRWRPPEPPVAWEGVRDALERGSKCAQRSATNPAGDVEGDEDCLFLNVWTPALTPDEPLPVMVWFHRGAWVVGSAGTLYDGAKLAAHGAVVVTLNYRLGTFGFMAHPALTAEDGDHVANWGYLDQRAALEWVQRNAASFGGDPARVTIFGESAGGHAVCSHLASPGSAGLFHRAISQSGVCAFQLPTVADSEARGVARAQAAGCEGEPAEILACLRAAPVDQLLEIYDPRALPGGIPYQDFPFPTVGGAFLPTQIDEALADGADVPFMVGSTSDEGALLHSVVYGDPVADEAEYRAALAVRWSAEDVEQIVAQYPVADHGNANAALREVTNDAWFVCFARRLARLTAESGSWLYLFDQPLAGTAIADIMGTSFHGSDVAFVFGSDGGIAGHVGDDALPLQEAVQTYWTRFAATGNPNDGRTLEWPAYDAAGDMLLRLKVDPEVEAGYRADRCAFWETLY